MGVAFEGDFFEKLGRINSKAFLAKTTSETGAMAVNFSKSRFRKKNWVDKSQEAWEKRQYTQNKGSTLVLSGRLKRSIRKISEGKYYTLIGTDVPYAQIHNEGGTIKGEARVRGHSRTRKGRKSHRVRAHTRKINTKIPRRQFFGESETLGTQLEKHLYKRVNQELER